MEKIALRGASSAISPQRQSAHRTVLQTDCPVYSAVTAGARWSGWSQASGPRGSHARWRFHSTRTAASVASGSKRDPRWLLNSAGVSSRALSETEEVRKQTDPCAHWRAPHPSGSCRCSYGKRGKT